MSAAEPKSARLRHALSWDEVERDAAALARLAPRQGNWRGIVAVARGGLVPAVLVSRSLGIRVIESISMAAGDGKQDGASRVVRAAVEAGDGSGWLVIDDLVDSGETIKIIRRMLPRAHISVLYAKPAGRLFVDSFVREFSQDSWIDFPWEAAAPDILS